MAEQLAKKIELEKNELAKKVEELSKELEAARHPHTHGSSDSGDDSNESNTSGNLNSGVCDMVSSFFSRFGVTLKCNVRPQIQEVLNL